MVGDKENIQVLIIVKMWVDNKWQPIVSAIFNLILNIILIQYIGVNGVILSTIVSMAVVDIPWETGKLLHKLFEQSSKKCYIILILYFILTIISCAVVHFITIEINIISTCGKIILKGIISVIISSFIVALFTFRTREFKYLIKYINSKIKR